MYTNLSEGWKSANQKEKEMDNNSFCFNEYFLEEVPKNDRGKRILIENLQYTSNPERVAWHILLEYKLSYFELQILKKTIGDNDWIQMEKKVKILQEIMLQESFHW